MDKLQDEQQRCDCDVERVVPLVPVEEGLQGSVAPVMPFRSWKLPNPDPAIGMWESFLPDNDSHYTPPCQDAKDLTAPARRPAGGSVSLL